MFEALYTRLEGPVVDQVLAGFGAATALAAAALTAAIGVYMVIASYAVLRGIAGEGFGHVLTQGVKASLVLLAVQSGIGGVTAIAVMDLPDTLAVVGAPSGNPGTIADDFTNQVVDDAMRLVKQGAQPSALPESEVAPGPDFSEDPEGWTQNAIDNAIFGSGGGAISGWQESIETTIREIVLWIVAIIPIVLAYLLAALIVVIVLFLYFALAVTALFGPIFVALLLFDSTRGMFFGWLATALSYAITIVIIGITVSIISGVLGPLSSEIVDNVIAVGEANPRAGIGAMEAAFMGLLGMTGIIFVGGIFLLQAQGIAQGIAGGGGGSAGGVAGALIPSSFTVRAAVSGLSNKASSFAAGARNRAQETRGFVSDAVKTSRAKSRLKRMRATASQTPTASVR